MKTFKKKPLRKASAKAQSAMEYLMTYGWAILIIAVVLGALFQLGVFNANNFAPKAPPGACQVFRPNGPYTTSFINLEGICSGELPQYVAQFNGQSSSIEAQTSVFEGKSFTVSMWIYPTVQNAGHYQLFIASGQSLAGDKALLIGTNINTADSNYYMAFYGDDIQVPGNVFIPNRWYYITAEWNNITKVQELFLNGTLLASRTSTGSLNTGTSVFDIGSGINTAWGGDYFNGQIADVQIYNTSLSANEIQALYLEGIGGAPINLQYLVGWWPLNGNANDYSGNGNNGKANNVNFVSNWYSGYTPP